MAKVPPPPLPYEVSPGGQDMERGMVRVLDAAGNTLFITDKHTAQFIVERVNAGYKAQPRKKAGWANSEHLLNKLKDIRINHSVPPRGTKP